MAEQKTFDKILHILHMSDQNAEPYGETTDKIINVYTQFLTQKQQEYINAANDFDKQGAKDDYALTRMQQDVIDELLARLKGCVGRKQENEKQ